MQANSDNSVFDKISFLVGNEIVIKKMEFVSAKSPFSEDICLFLNDLSGNLKSLNVDRFPDIATLAFWIRKSSLSRMKARFNRDDGNIRKGRGVIFHVAPSNVPVNFAYSLVSGLVTGNANVVRVPSKQFKQVELIANAINETLEAYKELKQYIALIRYERDRSINDYLSMFADIRVVWGGDETIAELRKSPIGSRTTEVNFADRYSLSIIDSDEYLDSYKPDKVAQDFYNDTYLTDQNACTSPFLIVWTGSKVGEAKEIFWNALYELVKIKYSFQDIQGVNKLTSSYITLAQNEDARLIKHKDNLVVRVQLEKLDNYTHILKVNSGFFLEYNCKDILDLVPVCNNIKCQTIGYIGKKDMIKPLLEIGIKGVDRVVPIGKTMDFDLIWDGYDLTERFTRIIKIKE